MMPEMQEKISKGKDYLTKHKEVFCMGIRIEQQIPQSRNVSFRSYQKEKTMFRYKCTQ